MQKGADGSIATPSIGDLQEKRKLTNW